MTRRSCPRDDYGGHQHMTPTCLLKTDHSVCLASRTNETKRMFLILLSIAWMFSSWTDTLCGWQPISLLLAGIIMEPLRLSLSNMKNRDREREIYHPHLACKANLGFEVAPLRRLRLHSVASQRRGKLNQMGAQHTPGSWSVPQNLPCFAEEMKKFCFCSAF